MRLSKEEATEYGLRGARKKRITAQTAIHHIEGENVTIGEIARRIDRSQTVAKHRLHREKAKPGPVTWEGLRSAS